MYSTEEIRKLDENLANIIEKEVTRQREKIELIASENFVSAACLEALGTPLTNKYAEGYPGKRYYGGCEHVDVVEQMAIDYAKELFGADHANVQPHSGASANLGVFFAMLNVGDTVLSMSLNDGGHLSHGSSVNISGKYFNIVPYGVEKGSCTINYDNVRQLALQHRPRLILAGASAYPRAIDFKIFSEIAQEVGAYLLVDMAHIAGLVAAGLHQSPVPYADFVTSTTHKTLRGPRSGMILCKEQYAKNIDKAIFPGLQGGPLMHTIAAKAVCFKEALSDEFNAYQQQVIKNARCLASAFVELGFDLVTGGTDNHLMLLDLTKFDITGKEFEHRLDEVGITVNKNTIPFETRSPFVTSGLRVGVPAVTTRGFVEEDMKEIAQLFHMTLKDESKEEILKRVAILCKKHPLYGA